MSMRLTIVGSGDAFGSGGRFNTCFRVESVDAAVLIDCGASTMVALGARRMDPNRLDGVIISHLHGDHFGGLLIDAQHQSRRRRPSSSPARPARAGGSTRRLNCCFPARPRPSGGSPGRSWRSNRVVRRICSATA
jgi:ribonuclease BN (tRNA processing enzyme)